MTSAEALVLVASIVSVGQFGAEIDRGKEHGLAVGDRGAVFYELRVNGVEKRINVGGARIATVDRSAARIELTTAAELRRGFRVEFEIEQDRLAGTTAGSTAGNPLDSEVRVLRFADSILIEQGLYEIGLPIQEAEFFNQAPPFRVQLESFSIDSRPVTRGEYLSHNPAHRFSSGKLEGFATGLSFEEAGALCRARGMRLPTEFEWEVGVRRLGPPRPVPVYEWTSSWYLSYPGNERSEESYGRRFRVVRGAAEAGDWDAFRRGYLEPAQRQSTVGFRCVAASGRPN